MTIPSSRVEKIANHVFKDTHIGPLHVNITCVQLNCHAMDFDNILSLHIEGIAQAKAKKSRIVCFPELSLCGYGCEDHFFENDTEMHCWCSVKTLLDHSHGVLIDIGMPVAHRGSRFNCRVLIMDGDIIGIRPKCFMAQEGVYRELRYFTPWSRDLMDQISVNGFGNYPFGIFYVAFNDCSVGVEICEEMWTPKPVHTDLFLNGVDIVMNSSGSCHTVGKLVVRRQLVLGASMRRGGVYTYTNFSGNDGGLLCFDGASLVTVDGKIVKEGPFLGITNDVECIHASVDIQQVRNNMVTKNSAGIVAMEHIGKNGLMHSIQVDKSLCMETSEIGEPHRIADWPETPRKYSTTYMSIPHVFGDLNKMSESLESLKGMSLWMWDFIRRCEGAKGFFVPLSGGADSGVTVGLIYFMCDQLVQAIQAGTKDVIRDVSKLVKMDEKQVYELDTKKLMSLICATAYIASGRSSEVTRLRAQLLAEQTNSKHLEVDIESTFNQIKESVGKAVGTQIQFKTEGGPHQHDIALQNLQARLRMVFSYNLASVVNRDQDNRFMLVIATGNASETLSGYFTKYDCSSGDINPIGGVSKREIYLILEKLYEMYGFQSFQDLAKSRPTPELRPVEGGKIQCDENDMGLSYNDLSRFAYLRGVQRCGPVQAYLRSIDLMPELSREEVATKVQRFFRRYSTNRHKTSIRTPSYNFKQSSPEDSRNDHRQLIYPAWTRQFRVMDALVNKHKVDNKKK